MKKIYTSICLFLFMSSFSFAQTSADFVGTWRMAPQAQAMAVGPDLGSADWWSNSADDVTTRACFFDDTYVFSADGTFKNVMGGETWIEPWQGSDPEACGTPTAPLDGSSDGTWAYASNQITINGVGSHLALAKGIQWWRINCSW